MIAGDGPCRSTARDRPGVPDRTAVLIGDVRLDPDYRSYPGAPAAASSPCRSGRPMVVGVVNLESPRVNAYGIRDLETVVAALDVATRAFPAGLLPTARSAGRPSPAPDGARLLASGPRHARPAAAEARSCEVSVALFTIPFQRPFEFGVAWASPRSSC